MRRHFGHQVASICLREWRANFPSLPPCRKPRVFQTQLMNSFGQNRKKPNDRQRNCHLPNFPNQLLVHKKATSSKRFPRNSNNQIWTNLEEVLVKRLMDDHFVSISRLSWTDESDYELPALDLPHQADGGLRKAAVWISITKLVIPIKVRNGLESNLNQFIKPSKHRLTLLLKAVEAGRGIQLSAEEFVDFDRNACRRNVRTHLMCGIAWCGLGQDKGSLVETLSNKNSNVDSPLESDCQATLHKCQN